MKILRCIHSLDPAIGGPLESVKQSTLVLQRRGHAVEIASLDAPGAQDFPVPVHALGPGRGSYGYSARFVPWLKENRERFDAVVVHGIWQYNSFGVWRALHGSATPYFVFPHGMLDPWFNRTYPLKHLKKLLYWPWAEYRVLRDAAAVLFTSEEEKRLARESFALYQAKEVVVNYGTAAPEVDWAAAEAEFGERFPQLRGQRFFLFLGRLAEKKGCDLLIEAFAKSLGKGVSHLVLAGPGADESYLKRLRELARDLPVVFTGMLSGNLKWGALRCRRSFRPAFASGEFRHRDRRSARLRHAGFDFQGSEHLARSGCGRWRFCGRGRSRRDDAIARALARAPADGAGRDERAGAANHFLVASRSIRRWIRFCGLCSYHNE